MYAWSIRYLISWGSRFIYRSIRGWYQKQYSLAINEIMCSRPYTYVAARWFDTCTHINSEIILVMWRVSHGNQKSFLTPLFKEIILDWEIRKNQRPLSNQSFHSKLTARTVCVQLVIHLDKNGLHEVFQSDYRHLHSTETALLGVQNDILHSL